MIDETSRIRLAPGLDMCQILNGMWQVAGGHGAINPQAAVNDMASYAEDGFTTWDLADHYGPAEDFIGAFRQAQEKAGNQQALHGMQAFTKWVPPPGPMTRSRVQDAVGRSLSRMRVDVIDLLQFHWWEYDDNRYLDALLELARLRQAGVLAHLGLTNFDTKRLAEICGQGIPIVSNQVQYSLIDRRPEVRMAALCQERGIGLLAYGALCGGLISERYLGRPEPTRSELGTVSLRKYKPMIDAWGGWDLFQSLLRTLNDVARRHQVNIPNVAVRYILDRPAVAGVIIGVRLGVAEHRTENARVFSFALDGTDVEQIESVLGQSQDLFSAIGDCGDEYRR